MINQKAKLNPNTLEKDKLEKKSTRDGFGKGVVEAGKADERVVVVDADLAESTRAEYFKKEFPERWIEVGVAEQNLATIGAGLANYGKIPFVCSYAAFSPGRNFEQIRTTIALNNVPVKVCGMHAGVSVGPDGATHQMLEDIALMRALPNMTVIVPCDVEEARKVTVAAAGSGKPTYLRFGRANAPIFTTPDTPFEIGHAEVFWEGKDPEVAIIACGSLVWDALMAAEILEKDGIETMVINNHTIKPMDERTITEAAKRCGAVVTVEEHQVAGGMGSAVSEILAQRHPVPIEFIGVHDKFGQSGDPDELIAHYGMDISDIAKAAEKVLKRKNSRA